MPASVPTCLVPASKLTCAPPVANVQNCRGSPTQQLRRSACFGNTSKLSRVRQICHRHVHQNRHAAGLVRSAADNIEQQFSKCAAKALEVNLCPLWYGVLAEIGAGQEVARWFFRVGGAAGTIAKSISAYDMTISDAEYGKTDRYVTRDRVEAMLDSEYLSCNLTLRNARGDNTAFFAFADTVVAKAFNRDNECHGWLGFKYQLRPGVQESSRIMLHSRMLDTEKPHTFCLQREPNTIMLHCRMLDNTAQAQQEALGVLGVNLIHGALTKGSRYQDIISGLLEEMPRSRMQVDLLDFSGPDFRHVDNRVAALRLVQKNLCDAALFDPQGRLQIPQEALRKKNVLITRGRFRPFTLLHNDMLMGAAQQFFCDPPAGSMFDSTDSVTMGSYDECVYRDDTMVLLELTTRDMMEGGDLLDWTTRDGGIQEAAFLQRIEALSTMGYSVLLSNYRRYFSLAGYLSTFTRESIVIAMGIPSLAELFKEKHYTDLDGGILEGFGRLLKYDLKLYVYPTKDDKTGQLVTADTLKVEPQVQKLFDYIRERGTIIAIQQYDKKLLIHGDVSKVVAESIRIGTDDWEELVPNHVRDQIKSLHLLGYNPNLQKLLHGEANVNGNGKLPELKSSAQPAQVAPK